MGCEKAMRNWKDHRVSFDEAVEVFRDLNGIEEIDEDHSTEEETRFYRSSTPELPAR